MSPGTSKGTLISLPWHLLEGEMAKTKATSEENEATATVNVSAVTQVTAYISRDHCDVKWKCKRMKSESHKDIVICGPGSNVFRDGRRFCFEDELMSLSI